jgi:hypothetical protein
MPHGAVVILQVLQQQPGLAKAAAAAALAQEAELYRQVTNAQVGWPQQYSTAAVLPMLQLLLLT